MLQYRIIEWGCVCKSIIWHNTHTHTLNRHIHRSESILYIFRAARILTLVCVCSLKNTHHYFIRSHRPNHRRAKRLSTLRPWIIYRRRKPMFRRYHRHLGKMWGNIQRDRPAFHRNQYSRLTIITDTVNITMIPM